ncbi:MAG: EAL domain-containing protein [Gammaproteobacteria bacterium]|nr:EAL domain-containing protein [Gammaproteobacteria bacterium]
MKRHRLRFSGNSTIIMVGAIVVLYLGTIIGFGHIGQARLRQALLLQEQLVIDRQAAEVAHFVRQLQQEVENLAADQSVTSFLANRDLGMSMRYGLRASLNAVQRRFRSFAQSLRQETGVAVSQLGFHDADGKMLLNLDPGDAASDLSLRDLPTAPSTTPMLLRDQVHPKLAFTSPVTIKDSVRASVTMVVEAKTLLRPLLDSSSTLSSPQRIAVTDKDGNVVAAEHGPVWAHWYSAAQRHGQPIKEARIGETGLRIVSLSQATLNNGVITSSWFLAALAGVSLPLVWGIIHLLRLNNHNLVLKTRYQSTTQQRVMLRQQNERLQREIDKRLASEEKLAHQASYDQLTGLPNRNLATDRLAQAVKWAKREDGKVLVMFLDLDRFKQVNDSLGHSAGDELLRQASKRLQRAIRDSDTVSRLGGDEFLVICVDAPNKNQWEHCAQQLLNALSKPFVIGGHEFYIGASIGVAVYPHGGDEPIKLLKNADIAMYAAKERGRNRYCLYDPGMDVATVQRLQLENNLRHALERNEMHIAYQPIVELVSGRTIAVEALLRWDNPQFGNVSPDRFIPIAEETGLIHEIGEWVLYNACAQIAEIQDNSRLRLAINLSTKQFSRPAHLLDAVLRALRHSGLMPFQLELEVTESLLIDDDPEVVRLLGQLDRIGVRLSVDDFGTGYSALNYLQRFPFDVLKIDRSFTAQIPDNDANATLIRAIIAMAHALELEVVAEGIERREQAGFLLVQHCEYGQGYLYSKPLSLDELEIHLGTDAALSA